MTREALYITLACGVLFSACAALPQNYLTLEKALSDDRSVTMPMRLSEQGLLVLKDVKIEGKSLDMVVDTGATQSAIFQSAKTRFNFEFSSDQNALVHGMMQSQIQKVVSVPRIEIGGIVFADKTMIVLNDKNVESPALKSHDGIIGMDILSGYQLYIPRQTDELVFIKNTSPVDVSPDWPRIALKENPFHGDDRDLHFMDVRVAGKNTTALFDTGANFSVMNWAAANYPQVRHMRRRLKRDWEFQGANGDFTPTAKLKIGNLRSGQVFWTGKEFIVIDIDSLDVLGIENQPFIIAGMNLFKERSLFIDFERNFLALSSSEQPLG